MILNDNELNVNAKLEALLLNKIEGLKWNYFEVDINNAFSGKEMLNNKDEIKRFFKAIKEGALGEFYYDGKISTGEVVKIIFSCLKFDRGILINVVKRLFDINKIVNKSRAHEGIMGKFNTKDREYRDSVFENKIRSGFTEHQDNIIVLAEGDSWFQFPRIHLRIDAVKDIIDWLMEDKKYAIKSLAAGGDWLSNMFYTGEYIEELSRMSPDVFLLSGGGNDLVGGNRLSSMVINPILEGRRSLDDDILKKLLKKRVEENNKFEQEKYLNGITLLSKEFFDLLNISFIQYFAFLYNIVQLDKYKKMLIITQGYDYVIPFNEKRGNWLSLQRMLNNKLDSGHWLFEPLNLKRITNKDDQESVMYAMIHEFNEMLIQLANSRELPNLFHIDCRGLASEKDWFDELHLKSNLYKIISKIYNICIKDNLRLENKNSPKVYKVTKYLDEVT